MSGSNAVARARTVLRFLNGEGPIDGVWFGERPADAKGNFWWRRHLKDIEAALAFNEAIAKAEGSPPPLGEGL